MQNNRERSASPERGRSPSVNAETRGRSRSRSAQDNGEDDHHEKREKSRSKSPQKFAEKDFDRKKQHNDSMQKRKNAIAKARGLHLNPKDWTRQELLEKVAGIGKFTQDKKTGVGEMIVANKRLLNDDINVMLELIRRTTEIQTISLYNCGLSDEEFEKLCTVGLKSLRHLKQLQLIQNQLTSKSVEVLINTFIRSTRQPLHIDLNGNNLIFNDGVELYRAFPLIKILCGIPLSDIKSHPHLTLMDLHDCNLKFAEIGVVSCVVAEMKNLNELNLAKNNINSLCLVQLIDFLETAPNINKLDLSYNPITTMGTDLAGLERLVIFVKNTTSLTQINLDGVEIPLVTKNKILQSLGVNRSVQGDASGYHFNKHMKEILIAKEKPEKRPNANVANWKPKFVLDHEFVKVNRIPVCLVEFDGNDIILTRKEYPKNKLRYEIG